MLCCVVLVLVSRTTRNSKATVFAYKSLLPLQDTGKIHLNTHIFASEFFFLLYRFILISNFFLIFALVKQLTDIQRKCFRVLIRKCGSFQRLRDYGFTFRSCIDYEVFPILG